MGRLKNLIIVQLNWTRDVLLNKKLKKILKKYFMNGTNTLNYRNKYTGAL